jgi:hypothetical protein
LVFTLQDEPMVERFSPGRKSQLLGGPHLAGRASGWRVLTW